MLSKNHLGWLCIFWTGLSHQLEALPRGVAVPGNPSLPKGLFHCQNLSIIAYIEKSIPCPSSPVSLHVCDWYYLSKVSLVWGPNMIFVEFQVTVAPQVKLLSPVWAEESLWYSANSTNNALEGLHQVGQSVIPLQWGQRSQCCLQKLPGKEVF